MFLHYILTRNDKELLAKFFKAQNENPSKGDWVNIVRENLKEFGIKEDFETIKHISKGKFKKIVKESSKKVAFEKLSKVKEKHSKSKVLNHSEIGMKNYFKNQHLYTDQIKFLFKLRSRMLNFKSKF